MLEDLTLKGNNFATCLTDTIVKLLNHDNIIKINLTCTFAFINQSCVSLFKFGLAFDEMMSIAREIEFM